MARKSLIEAVMNVEDCTREEAIKMVADCRKDLMERLEDGEIPDDILEEWFGLEPDWLDELL